MHRASVIALVLTTVIALAGCGPQENSSSDGGQTTATASIPETPPTDAASADVALGDLERARNEEHLASIAATKPLSHDELSAIQAASTPAASPDKVISALSPHDQAVTSVMRRMGFPPAGAPPTLHNWAVWPAIHQLEVGYRYADAADPGPGGVAFLKKVARLVAAEHNPAIRYEPAIAPWITEASLVRVTESPSGISFSVPTPTQARAPLPPDVRKVIDAVIKHTSSVSFAALAAACCDVDPNDAQHLQSTSETDGSALHRAFEMKPPPPTITEKAGRLAREGLRQNAALAFDSSVSGLFETFHPAPLKLVDVTNAATPRNPDFPPDPDHPDPSPPGPAPSPTSDSQAKRAVETEYRTFLEENYSRPGAMEFSRMVTTSEGFGGVIYGNSVLPPAGNPRLTMATWVALPGRHADRTSPEIKEPWGRLMFRLSNGRLIYSDALKADTVAAAKGIAFDARPVAHGVGLVGLGGRDKDFKEFKYVVNPHIVTRRFGRAMMLLDTLPMTYRGNWKSLHIQMNDSGVPKVLGERIDNIFTSDNGEYKFTDTKLQIVLTPDDRVEVQRPIADAGLAGATLRSTAFITFRSFREDPHDSEAPEVAQLESRYPIYQLMPILIRTSDPFARANEFAKAFALLRWARSSGATWRGPSPQAPDLPPATILRQRAPTTFEFQVDDGTDAEGADAENAALMGIQQRLEAQGRPDHRR